MYRFEHHALQAGEKVSRELSFRDFSLALLLIDYMSIDTYMRNTLVCAHSPYLNDNIDLYSIL
jgi:hypothetical protein